MGLGISYLGRDETRADDRDLGWNDPAAPGPGMAAPAARRAPNGRRLLCGRRDAPPILHLQASDQDVFAVLGTENRRLAFLHVEPILSECVEDVRLVSDQKDVGGRLLRCRQ